MRLALALCVAGAAFSQEYTTYLGDSATYKLARVWTDPAGASYVAGNRSSGAVSDIFVTKLDAGGNEVFFSAFGGNGVDTVADMAVDSAGYIYLAGATSSTEFPLHNAMQTAAGPGFVVKLNPDATAIVFSTYFPAAINAIAVDSAGSVYVTGGTVSASFPVTTGMPAGAAGGGVPQIGAAFITKISADGSHIVYSGRMSGQNKPCGCCSSCFLSGRYASGVAIAVDGAGNAYVAGNADTTDMPTTAGAFLQSGIGAWVAKVTSAGGGLSYLTYIGSTNYVISPYNSPGNGASALAVDAAGDVYLAGTTTDPRFPATAGAYQTAFAGTLTGAEYPPPPGDAFALKLRPDGSGLIWATYLGGTAADAAKAMALDAAGNVWLAGTTASANFPNAQGWSEGSDFLTGLKPDGSALIYAARYPGGTVAQSIAVDAAGVVHAAGAAGAVSAIVPASAPKPRIFGIANAAYGQVGAQLARNDVISIYGPHIGPVQAMTFTPDANGFAPTSLGGVQVTIGSTALPLLYVSESQINAVVPAFFPGNSIRVVTNAASTPDFSFTTASADPQIFQHADGTAAVNPDGSLNSESNPAHEGDAVSIWLTGASYFGSPLQDGQIATAAAPISCCSVTATVVPGTNAGTATVLYSGAAPGDVSGIVQINFLVPSVAGAAGISPPPGVSGTLVPLTVQALSGGETSSAVTLWVVH